MINYLFVKRYRGRRRDRTGLFAKGAHFAMFHSFDHLPPKFPYILTDDGKILIYNTMKNK